jgi:hypothetical protein
MPEQGDEEDHHEGRGTHSPQRRGPRQMQCVDDVGDAEHRKHIEEHTIDIACAHAEQHVTRIFADHVDKRDCNLASLCLELAEFRRLHDAQADIETDDHQYEARNKSDAPTPGEKLLLGQSRSERHNTRRQAKTNR